MKADEFDSIIFDCDGVLIDVTKSYDVTINKTISYVLKEIADIIVDMPLTNETLSKFKATGGFNDEIDITYSGILCYIVAKKLNKDPTELILDVLSNADFDYDYSSNLQSGMTYIENFLTKKCVDVVDIKSRLNYPSTDKNDLIHATFDQLFFGPELYSKIFQKKSKFSDKGLIENDNVIVNSELIEALKKKFNDKIAIVTGRGFNAISSSLKELLNQFNVENSVFLEDEPRDLAKPNPQSLIRAMKGLNSKNCLYVGDSMEDKYLTEGASELGFQATFCGIYGSSKLPEMKKNMFATYNAPFILESINSLPKALNLV